MGSSKKEEFRNHLTGVFNTEGERIIPKEYFENFNNEIEEYFKLKPSFDEPEKLVNQRINVKLLDYEGEPAKFDYNPAVITKDSTPKIKFLNKNTCLNVDLDTVKSRSTYDFFRCYPKYSLHQFTPFFFADSPDFPPISDTVLIVFKVYRPFISDGRMEDVKIQQEIILTGDHTLKTLEEKIHCTLDYCGLKDVSEDKNAWNEVTLNQKAEKIHFPSYFFFVNNKFYVHGPVDLSQIVREFLDKVQVGSFLAETVFPPLKKMTLQVGRPYLYQHLGQCEHIFMISDMRLRGPGDPDKYPVTTVVTGAQAKKCMLCAKSYARWLVTNYLKLTMARAFLCHRCFVSYCYVDGRKAGPFQAYQYLDPGIVT